MLLSLTKIVNLLKLLLIVRTKIAVAARDATRQRSRQLHLRTWVLRSIWAYIFHRRT